MVQYSLECMAIRERPVEAGIDPGFSELDEAREARLRRLAFDEHMAGKMDKTVQEHLTTAGISTGCDSRRLNEVRICLSKELQFRDCAQVDQRACRRDKLVMPPVRGG